MSFLSGLHPKSNFLAIDQTPGEGQGGTGPAEQVGVPTE
jgi:hypothetical protein